MAIYVPKPPTSEQIFVFNLLNHISGISYYISAVVNPILYRWVSVRIAPWPGPTSSGPESGRGWPRSGANAPLNFPLARPQI